MQPLEIMEDGDRYSLQLVAGDAPVDEDIVELGHEPNGYFWEGVAEYLVRAEAGELADRFELDSEGGAFVAYSSERKVLEDLGNRMAAIATSGEKVRRLVASAEAAGFEFDD